MSSRSRADVPLESGLRERPGRVLIIDDDPYVAESMRRLLSDENHVTTVSRAQDGLTRIEAGERYDVILCDILMPEMDGMQLYERLRVVLPREADRLVFFSGGGESPPVRAFLDRVSNLLIEKPPDMDGLRALIHRRIRDDAIASLRAEQEG
jgi:CheY-like chemotaxis protein